MKIIGFGKHGKRIWILLLVWLIVLITVAALTATKAVNGAPRRLPVYAVETTEKKVALTFNAAWGDETTDGILRILADTGTRATFFFVGDFAEKYPDSVRKICNAGHEPGNHSMRHRDPTRMRFEEIAADITACNDAIRAAAGVSPVLYRAPSGAYDTNTVEAAESLGMTAIQWSVDSVDWKNITPEKMRARMAEKVYPGAILLFHLGKENTLAALPGILNDLYAAGYEVCAVGDLLPEGGGAVDRNGVLRQTAAP